MVMSHDKLPTNSKLSRPTQLVCISSYEGFSR